MENDIDLNFEKRNMHPSNPYVYIYESKWRVKLYKLNLIGQWDDMGTGYVSIIKDEEEYYIKMFSETDNMQIFELKITSDIDFHRQRGTILTWKGKEEEEDDDSAISFQEKEGVQEVWKFICYIKGIGYQSEVNDFEEDEDDILSIPTLENLAFIARTIRIDNVTTKVMRIVEKLNSDNGFFIKKLGELLESEEKKFEEKKSEFTKQTQVTEDIVEVEKESEAKENSHYENLSLIFTIFKNIIYLADQNLLEMLVSDDLYLITFGALEYDFDSVKMIKHRQFFKDQVQFNNLLNIDDPKILYKIHLNYRLNYLKDTAIGRFIEEVTIKSINFITHYNNNDIIQYFLENNEHLLEVLFEKIKENDIKIRYQGISFLLELINCCKEIIQSRVYFFETLCDRKIIEVLQEILSENEKFQTNSNNKNSLNEVEDGKEKQENIDINKIPNENKEEKEDIKEEKEEILEREQLKEKIKIKSVNILCNIITQVPNYFKNYLTSKSEKTSEYPLFELLCDILLYHDNFGIKYEIFEIMKNILDNDIIEKKNEIYEIFLNKCMKKLTDYLMTVIDSELTDRFKIRSTKQIIIELICHCLSSHGQRFKYWIIHNDLIPNVVDIVRDNEKILDIQVVKFVKSILINNDENLIKVLITNNCFKKIIEIFEGNRKKRNMCYSLVLDLFDYINKNTVKKIITHLVEDFEEFTRSEDNKEVFKAILDKYNHGLDQFSSFRANETEEKAKFTYWNQRELSAREDEDYFSEDEEDIFRDDQIIKNLEKVTSLYEKGNKEEELYEKKENIINNTNSLTENIPHLKDCENKSTSSKNLEMEIEENNLKLIDDCKKENDEENIQLLGRKKLIADDEQNFEGNNI